MFEHIDPIKAKYFINKISKLLSENGTLIVGAPSLASQIYASEISRLGHINCMNGEKMVEFFKEFFNVVQIFSMNDEVMHTGFLEMSHYYFVVCSSKKQTANSPNQ